MSRRASALVALLLLAVPALSYADGEDSPKKGKKDKSKSEAVVAHIRLAGDLDETPTAADPLFGDSSESFKTKLDRLAKAKATPTSKPSSCKSTTCRSAGASSTSLRKAIADVRAGGKKVYAYLESADAQEPDHRPGLRQGRHARGRRGHAPRHPGRDHLLQGLLREAPPSGRLPADGRLQRRGRAVHAVEHVAAIPQAVRDGHRRLL